MASASPRELLGEGLAALRRGDARAAITALEAAAEGAAPGEMPWIALANAHLSLQQPEAAERAVDNQLLADSRDLSGLFFKGWLREQVGDTRAAVSFYTAALAQADAAGGVPQGLETLRDHGRRFLASAPQLFARHLDAALGEAGELSATMTEAVEMLRGERQLYLPSPSVFYYPGLAPRRFFDPAEFPWLGAMLAAVPAMQAELAAVLSSGGDGFDPYVRRTPNRPAPANPLLDNPAWTAFHFWKDGATITANAARCPATMAALTQAPMPRIDGRSPNAHWSRLTPGAHIRPHVGMLNCRLICHVPILTAPRCSLRVGSETRTWEPGVPLIFDDSIEHEARNDGPSERVVLLFEIWRPEIPEADRAAIARIFQAIGSYAES